MTSPIRIYKRNMLGRLLRGEPARFIVGTALGLAVALLLAFNALLLWVATGPRSLAGVTPYIESALAPGDGSYSVRIGESWLIWDGWRHPIDFRLKGVTVLTRAGQTFSTFPQISLGLDVVSLAVGRLLPTSVTITHPVISLFQNDDRSISFGFRKEEPVAPETPAAGETDTAPLAAVLAPLLAGEGGNLRKLSLISIRDADVSLGSHKGILLKADGADIMFERDRHGTLQAVIGATIKYDTNQSSVKAQFTVSKESPTIEGDIAFADIMPATLASLFSASGLPGALKLPVSGKAMLTLDMNGALQQLRFTLEGGQGKIVSDRLEGSIPVKALHVAGRIGNAMQEIEIDRFTAELDGGMQLAASGKASLNNGNVAAVRADCVLKNASVAGVRLLWPPKASPMSREWVVANIMEGKVTEATAHIDIAPGDLGRPNLPKKAIDASIALEGAKIRYLPDHPPVTGVQGTVHVDAESLSADIKSGDYMTATKLSGGKLLIDDLNADNPYIKVNFNAESDAKDIVKFLGLPRLKHAARLGLHEESAEGTVTGHAEVGFHFFAPRDAKGKTIGEPDVDYNVSAEVKGVTQPGFMGKFDIKDASGHMTVRNIPLPLREGAGGGVVATQQMSDVGYQMSKNSSTSDLRHLTSPYSPPPTPALPLKGGGGYIEFKGGGNVNGASVSQAEIKYFFKPENGLDTFIDAMATAPVESLPRFGYPVFPFLKGTLGVKANVKLGADTELSQAAIDLTHATVDYAPLKWNKPDKEPATFELTALKKNGEVTIPSFRLQGKDVEAKGSAELDKTLSDIRIARLDRLFHGNTDLDSFVYEVIDGGYHIEAHGKSADASPWVEKGDKEESTFSFERFPALRLKLEAARLVLGKGREFTAVKGAAECDAKRCESADIGGKTSDGKPFAFRILRNPKGQRQLSLHAQSAGAFLKAAGLFKGMEGGDLTVTGNYDDSGESSVLTARADINEHVIKDAPVLAKILSLASLTGFFDTLRGNGIHFDRLRAPFTLTRDVITFKGAKTHGDAIGMTADGTVTFPKQTLNIEGTLVPSYTLNNIVGHVPLVGNLLTGGEGQGLIAARYSVKGPADNPDVTVNPLSMLTPGFLRNIFDIFDRPEKETE